MLPSRIHLVGIGGAGMAGLAQYLLAKGLIVSGSDHIRSEATETLARAGATITYGHAEARIEEVQLVVASDAIPAGNVEVEAARRLGIHIMRRADCLDLLREGRRAIMVAGSHGKSTTGAMIACILVEAGLDPGFVLGADVPALGRQRARPGGARLFVAEACEAFRNLDSFNPDIAVITNIDDEHVNHYASQAALDEAFAAFAGRAAIAVVSGEDIGVARGLAGLGARISFGLNPGCDVWAEPAPAPFEPRVDGAVMGAVVLRQPGDHMRRNALAAIAACHAAGVAFAEIMRGLERFTGVARRWQLVGQAAGVEIIDDYAHHPAEVAATLHAARMAAPGQRVVAAFQPLLPSRVQRLHGAFAESLALADQVLLLEVDAGGEVADATGSANIAEGLKLLGVKLSRFADPDELVERGGGDLAAGDLLVVMGGTGMDGVAERLRQRLSEAAPATANRVRQRNWIMRLREARRAPETLITRFRAHARAHPGDPALIGHNIALSYAELDHASDAIAAAIAKRSFSGRVIGVCLPLGADAILALLGVMKAGSIYLPLDIALPEARARYMLEQAAAAITIGRELRLAAMPSVSLAALRAEGGSVPAAPRKTDGAYICFTSGSTGYPKGIQTSHAAYGALLRDTVERFAIGRGARMLLNTSISFDVSLAEIGSTLAGGGALLVGGTRPLAGERLTAILDEMQATHLSITPTLLASAKPRALPALRCIIACGEACPPGLVADWAPGRQFFNVYGPTETAIYATAADCVAGGEVTIGTALGHLQAHVLDDALHPVDAGELGELCLSGPGLAAGYLAQPDETAQRFVLTQGIRVYRTGDMVRLGADGPLRFIGRADEQVKLRGNRVELGEIEHAVQRRPGIADTAVCLGAEERPSLICFVQAEPGVNLDLAALSRHLAEWLPDSAVPSHILMVPQIHRTPSGKKDRRRMMAEHRSRIVTRASDFAPARTDAERDLASLWQEILGLDDNVGMFDRFTSLGGDSLSALIVIAGVETRFDIVVPPGYFGRLTTVPHMAVQLAELLWQGGGQEVAREGFTASRIFRQMRDLCGHWPGTRLDADSLISTLGPNEAAVDIFLSCQDELEFRALTGRLPDGFRLHAMRSGHLVIDNGPGGLRLLSARYAEEIAAIDPQGTLVLAGICQGGMVAQLVAERLAEAGRKVALLAMIEPGRPRPYAGAAALFCGEDSFLSPLRAGGTGLAPFDAALPGGYSLDTVPGVHGAVCMEPAVQFLAHHLVRRVEAVAPLGALR